MAIGDGIRELRLLRRAARDIEKIHRKARIRLPGFAVTFSDGCRADGEPWPCRTEQVLAQARMSSLPEEE